MTGSSLGEAIEAVALGLVAEATAADPELAGSAIVAIGWATVELDRAQRELGVALGEEFGTPPIGVGPWVLANREPVLGAAARVGPSLGAGGRLILLEPDTEGRLAALLARHGEGVAAVYVRTRAGADRIVVPALTSGPGGRPPTVLAGRPPSPAG